MLLAQGDGFQHLTEKQQVCLRAYLRSIPVQPPRICLYWTPQQVAIMPFPSPPTSRDCAVRTCHPAQRVLFLHLLHCVRWCFFHQLDLVHGLIVERMCESMENDYMTLLATIRYLDSKVGNVPKKLLEEDFARLGSCHSECCLHVIPRLHVPS